MTVKHIETHRSFQGEQRKYSHYSKVLKCDMNFSLYLPPVYKETELSLIWWLSGLTCTDDNFSQKSAFQKSAAEYSVALAIPDTSPRGETVPDDESYDLGQGASFYLNATQNPWSEHYQMYTYLTEELPEIIYSLIPNFSGKESVMGHSMGGHGALMLGLKEANRFKAISAFAPVMTPSDVPWGRKAFTAYLGTDQSVWQRWDSTYLIREAVDAPAILITQGTKDNFYETQLKEEKFLQAAKGKEVIYHLEEGYDHSYFTISTFIDEHIAFHAEKLNQ